MTPEERLARGDAVLRVAIEKVIKEEDRDPVASLMKSLLFGAFRRAYSDLPDDQLGLDEDWVKEARALIAETAIRQTHGRPSKAAEAEA